MISKGQLGKRGGESLGRGGKCDSKPGTQRRKRIKEEDRKIRKINHRGRGKRTERDEEIVMGKITAKGRYEERTEESKRKRKHRNYQGRGGKDGKRQTTAGKET